MTIAPVPAPVPRIALKVDVNTLRGTLQGVPNLVSILRRYGACATFFFSLGPDQTGRTVTRVFSPGVFKRARRTSVLQHYGLRTMLYGTLLAAPDIGLRAADTMRAVRDAGFEVGIHCWNHYKWQAQAAHADEAFTNSQMVLAGERFASIFGTAARAHAAAGWQTNKYSLRLMQRFGFDYGSDTRGTHPFLPVVDAELIACPQIPTTLPAVDELIASDNTGPDNVAAKIIDLAATLPAPQGHVYTLRAELEGMKLIASFEAVLAHWRRVGVELLSLAQYFEAAGALTLPHHTVKQGRIDARLGEVALQGEEFLAQPGAALA